MNENVAHSICKQCGRSIIWARRADDPQRWSRPLDSTSGVGAAVIDANGCVQWTHAYQFHSCNPDDIVSYANAMSLAARVMEQHEREKVVPLDENQRTERAYAISFRNHSIVEEQDGTVVNALEVDCPRCETGIGELCKNMSKGKSNGNMVMHPHVQRINAAKKVGSR